MFKEIIPVGKTRGLEIKKNYIISEINLDTLISDNNQSVQWWRQRFNNNIGITASPNLIASNQQIKALPNGEYQQYQTEYINNNQAQNAWEQTLMTAISHIVENAAQGREGSFFQKKKTNIEINAYKNKNEIIIEIKDDGEGIPKNIIEGLAQGAQRITNKSEGRQGGLGLISAQEAIAQLNGRMEIKTTRIEETKQGQTSGTTISFRLPLDGSPAKTNKLSELLKKITNKKNK